MIKKSLHITDREILTLLKNSCCPIEHENLVLDFEAKWNRRHIVLANGQTVMLTLSPNEVWAHSTNRNPTAMRLESTFEKNLISLLQKREELPVYLYYDHDFTIENHNLQ